jgi:hypothetical protein
MQQVSQLYIEGMGDIIRQPSKMRLTFHYPSGAITYTTEDITKVTETKTAHLIASELPSITLEMELLNLDGTFNPNDDSGFHDMIVEGVRVDYEFGYDIPLVKPYGYEGDGVESDPVYGMSGGDTPQYLYYTDEGFITIPQEAYGFVVGHETEWIPGGEVFTDGEISYDQDALTVTISAVDYLSKLDAPIYFGHGSVSLKYIVEHLINQTDYPEDSSGNKKIVIGDKLNNFTTAYNISGHSDEALPAKEWLQILAHAGGVQMYIDRGGYLHLDTLPEETSVDYHLPLDQQMENPEHSKLRIPKKLIVPINTEFDDPLEVDIGGGGEDMVVENPYIIVTSNAENLRDRIEDKFIPFRNEGHIAYRGEPALDILDKITFDAPFEENIEGTIVESVLTFDGTLEGELVLRYCLGENTPRKVKITGSGNFTFPLGGVVPVQENYTLICDTDLPSPTYKWSYFTVSDGNWKIIAGETTNTLEVNYDDSYFNNDDTVTFRCTVNNTRSSITRISKIQLVKSPNASYRGTIKAEDKDDLLNEVVSPEVGDIVLLDNTEEESGIYGETYVYNGDEWVATEESDALAMTYKDALQLAEDSGKTIYTSEIYADLIVTKKLRVQSGDFLAKINETDGVDVTYDGNKLFKVEPLTGKIYFGEHFWYDPATETIRSKNDKMIIGADGVLRAVDGVFKGTIEAGSSVPYSTVSGAPPSNADNTSTFFESGTAFQTANGKVKIHNDGTIEAVDGRFTGDVFANSGYFKGIFDTTALKLEPGGETTQSHSESQTNLQAKNFYDYFVSSEGLVSGTLYKATILGSSISIYTEYGSYILNTADIAYASLSYGGSGYNYDYYLRFYDNSFTDIGGVNTHVYTYGGITYSGSYVVGGVTVTLGWGGDKLIISSDTPTIDIGLDNYQIYIDTSTGSLKVKLP